MIKNLDYVELRFTRDGDHTLIRATANSPKPGVSLHSDLLVLGEPTSMHIGQVVKHVLFDKRDAEDSRG
jgi:hypothetical protein